MIAQTLEHHAADEPENPEVRHVVEHGDEADAIHEPVDDRRQHADQRGGGGAEQGHGDDLHREAGGDAKAARPNRLEVREDHRRRERDDQGHRLPSARSLSNAAPTATHAIAASRGPAPRTGQRRASAERAPLPSRR